MSTLKADGANPSTSMTDKSSKLKPSFAVNTSISFPAISLNLFPVGRVRLVNVNNELTSFACTVYGIVNVEVF